MFSVTFSASVAVVQLLQLAVVLQLQGVSDRQAEPMNLVS